ncbi:MAG: alpha-glycosidase [Firmicutes bacterium]|nr:alpha-glycosidase [Bacillota bacterium]
MNLQGVYHRPKSNFCYGYSEDVIDIRLRAAKDDLKEVKLVYGDKYDWDNSNKEVLMEFTCSDTLYDYYVTSITPPNKRLSYYFIVEDEVEVYYYTEWGLSKKIDKKDLYLQFFNYPYHHRGEIHNVPEWVKDAVFYQIFPERFYNGDKTNDPEDITEWGIEPKSNSFYGGDLKGIIEKLDYLEELGINAIYLTPIFEANTNHKYDTTNYLKVDPHFGDLDTLKELVSNCHEKGIKVILDAVFNHCGFDFKHFQDVLKKGKESRYFNWFHINKTPIDVSSPSYDAFAFVPNMPKLNTENPEVKKYLLNVATYWIKEADIDGWRLDVANEVDHGFWREFREAVKAVKSDVYIIGEIWHDSLPWLMGDQFDAIMNYPVTRACTEFFAYDNIDSEEFKDQINNTIMRNTRQVNNVMFNLLDSHDTSRFLTKCNEDIRKLKLASVFQLTYVGAPCIYYGTEIGITGGEDPDCRKTMDWDKKMWNIELYNFYRSMIQLRKDYEALRRGTFQWIDNLDGIIGYKRKTEKEEIIVLLNNSRLSKKVKLNIEGKKIINMLDTREEYPSSNEIELTINEHGFKMYVNKD